MEPGQKSLMRSVRKALREVADPSRAPAMQAYMKSSMPYHGVPMAEVRRVGKRVLANVTCETVEELEVLVRELWREARFREEWYVTLALLRERRHQKLLTARVLPLLEDLLLSGAWWDVVDEIATHLVSQALKADKVKTVKVLRGWSQGRELWLRRAAIIAQVGFKADTDVELLFEVIEPAVEEKEFFLRKAIGWALRALGPWKPNEVEHWLTDHDGRESGLTRREALKGLDPARRRPSRADVRR